GIIEYTDTTIRLNIGEKQLKIDGAQLGIKSIDSDDITVYGDIRAVEFI
ncbi:MAG TPA: YabP/YqfC family sporulation protein, partial [Candidatus Avimonoglobus intestinipullorum]|nr:YabP/YqfC family sporulation protein [Candidatus Avimonoglobus intestinipullorum]